MVAQWGRGAGSCREPCEAAGQDLPAQAQPMTPARGTGAAPALGIGHLSGDGDKPKLGWNVSFPIGSCRQASCGVIDAGTDGPGRLKWGPGPWAGLGELCLHILCTSFV